MGLPPKTPFEKWKDTINAARSDSSWNEYDNIIQQTVSAYNTHLAESPAFTRLDWKVIKAMVWTESGGPSNPAWKARPMQIGNQGDPGLDALLSGNGAIREVCELLLQAQGKWPEILKKYEIE